MDVVNFFECIFKFQIECHKCVVFVCILHHEKHYSVSRNLFRSRTYKVDFDQKRPSYVRLKTCFRDTFFVYKRNRATAGSPPQAATNAAKPKGGREKIKEKKEKMKKKKRGEKKRKIKRKKKDSPRNRIREL